MDNKMIIEIVGDNIIVPIAYADDDHITIDTDKIREDFECFMLDLEQEDYE